MPRIGIRREDKSRWEGRSPLVPADIRNLVREQGIEFTVQTSPVRAVEEDLYRQAGARIADDLSDCKLILGVKEIPVEKLEAGKAYVYFSHTIKGQEANMPALRRILELGGTLIDYERITDDQGRRLVFFGRFAGLAGMIDSLWALGLRLRHEGLADNPFATIQPSHRYDDLNHVRRAFAEVADGIRSNGLPESLRPFVCAFTGYGQVSMGAQEIYDLLPVKEVEPGDLADLPRAAKELYKVVFREEHLVRPVDDSRQFELQDYYDHPERYTDDFFPHARYIDLLMNCIYWEPKYPRVLSREQLAELYGGSEQPKLRVIGDISCDIDGSVACTVRSTGPDEPIYVYDPDSGETRDGVEGRGPVVQAVDFLPCELPVDASNHFSNSLVPFVGALARANFDASFADCGLPPELVRATIAYRGDLTENYRYLRECLGS